MESIGRSISSDELEYPQSSEDEEIISINNKDEDIIDTLFQIPVNGPVRSTEKLESSRFTNFLNICFNSTNTAFHTYIQTIRYTTITPTPNNRC